MAKKNRKLSMQALEQKAMMAGDVAVAAYGGDVWIDEAHDSRGDDQQVYVKVLNDGSAVIKGQNGTTINGQDQITVELTGDLNVDLGEGRDNLTMVTSSGADALENMNVDMGSGADRDFVSLNGFRTSGSVEIETGGGDDSLSISGATVGLANSRIGYSADLDIDTGAGRDVVSIYNTDVADDLRVKLYDYSNENDSEIVSIQSSNMDDLEVDMGGGNDDLNLYYNHMDEAHVDGDAGDDDVVAIGNQADDFEFDGDSGYDRFFAYYYGGQDSNDIDDLDLDSAYFNPYGQL